MVTKNSLLSRATTTLPVTMGKGSKTDAEVLIPSLALDEEIVASESRNSDTVSEDDLDSKFSKNDPKQQELPTDEAAMRTLDDGGFVWSATDEPHATRRKLILAQHPEIKQLYGHCWMLKYKVLLAGALQLVLAHHFRGLLVASSSFFRGSRRQQALLVAPLFCDSPRDWWHLQSHAHDGPARAFAQSGIQKDAPQSPIRHVCGESADWGPRGRHL